MSKPLKLFIDAHAFDAEFQGSRTYIKELYNRFPADNNIQLYFAAHNMDNLAKEIVQRDNVHFVEYKSHSRLKRLGTELPQLLKKLDIDYAHFQYIVPPVKVCKYIVTTHDVIFHDFPEEFSTLYKFNKHLLYRFSALRADILTTVSEFSKKSINRFFKIPLDKIHVIHNAVGEKYFLNYNKQAMKEYIREKYGIHRFALIVSRIEPRKNHVALVKAFKKLDLFKKGYSIVFIGTESIIDEKLNAELQSLTANERKQYHYLSDIPEEDLIAFYNAASVCAYPSKGEGFGIPPLESASLKTPTLCSNVSAMSDFDFFGEYGFDPADQPSFENKLIKVLNDGVPETELDEISKTIRSKYSWENSSKILYNLVKS